MQGLEQTTWNLQFLQLLSLFTWILIVVPIFSVLHQRLLPIKSISPFRHANPLGWFLELWKVLGLRSSRPYFFYQHFITRILISISLALSVSTLATIPFPNLLFLSKESLSFTHPNEFSLFFIIAILFLMGFVYTAIGFTLKPSLIQLTSLEQLILRQCIVLIIAFSCFSVFFTTNFYNPQTITIQTRNLIFPLIPSWGIFTNPIAFITATIALAFYTRQWINNEIVIPGFLRSSIETQLVGTLLVTFKIARSLEFLALYALLTTVFLSSSFTASPQIHPALSLGIFTLKLFSLVLFVIFVSHLLPYLREEKLLRFMLLILLPLTLLGHFFSTWILQTFSLF